MLRGPGCAWVAGSALGEDGIRPLRLPERFHRPGVSAHRWVWEHDLGLLPHWVLLRHSCDETNCVRLDHLVPGDHPANMADMCARGRQGGPRHRGHADIRGPAGRARAIRAVLQASGDPHHLGEVMSAGDPHRNQLTLFPAAPW